MRLDLSKLRMSKHAWQRLRERHIAVSEVLFALAFGPEDKAKMPPDQRCRRIRVGDLVVVVERRGTGTLRLLTCWREVGRGPRSPRRALPVPGHAALVCGRSTLRTQVAERLLLEAVA